MTQNPLRRLLAGVGLLSTGLLLVTARPAGATTITPGSVTFFNFNFIGQVPPPPYADVSPVTVSFANVDPGDTGTFDLFDGLNGTGVMFGPTLSGQVPTVAIVYIGPAPPQMLDGIFSLRVLGTAGTYDITSVVAIARTVTGATVELTGVPVAALPEPGTMVLVASGLGGALARRRRRQRDS